jgi:lipoprotein signal peptidase
MKTIGNNQLASPIGAMEPKLKKFVQILLDHYNIIWVHLVLRLISRLNSGVEFDVMLNNSWWNSLHVSIIPCTIFIILPK